MNEYEKQGKEFLKKTNATLEIEFKEHNKHFESDVEKRDIYNATIKRNGRSHTIKFGNSLNNTGIHLINKSNGARTQHKNFNPPEKLRKGWFTATTNEELRRAKNNIRRWFEMNHFTLGGLQLVMPKPPTEYEVLACLTSCDPEEFKDFCSNFSYDDDSIKARKTYDATINEWINLQRLFTEEQMRMLREIQ